MVSENAPAIMVTSVYHHRRRIATPTQTLNTRRPSAFRDLIRQRRQRILRQLPGPDQTAQTKVVERQMHYVLDVLRRMITTGTGAIEVRRDVHDEYNARIDAAHEHMIWSHPGPETYFKNSKGRIVVNNPFRIIDVWKATQEADLDRLDNKKDKTIRDVERAKGYLSRMKIIAPNDGIVNILPNTRTAGSFGSTPPPFKEGDRAWTGAAIAEIPDLSEMRAELTVNALM